MIIKIIALITLWFIVSGCGKYPINNSSNAYIFNKSLMADYQNLDESLKKKRIEINFASGKSVNNCVDYLTEIKASHIFDGVNNTIHHGEYLTCEALDLLKSHNIITPKQKTSYGELLSSSLDLSSFPSSVNQESQVYGKILQKLDPKNLKTGNYTVTRETDDWIYRIEVIAASDLNNDGTNDLILWLYDQAKNGNYHAYSTLIVPLYNNEKPLLATPYSEWKRYFISNKSNRKLN